MKWIFFLRTRIKQLEDYRLPFLYVLLSSGVKNLEDAKIKAKSTDTKHAFLVTSQPLNKYSLDS